MKIKLIIIALLILITLSISSVCASDVDNATIESTDDAIEQIAPTDGLTAVNEQGTFAELQDLIDKNNIVDLSKDYVMQNNISIKISKDITINGNGHTIDGNKKGTIFEITQGKVVLNNLILNKGKGSVNGGAVNVQYKGSLTCNQVTFSNNLADDYGGAVYIDSTAPATFTNCIFKKNEADDHDGGAIFSTTPITCTNCDFITNYAEGDGGGAIHAKGQLICINCNFEDNHVDGWLDPDGGAIYATDEILLTNCNFTNNWATSCGGAIAIQEENEKSCIIKNCNFKNNKATHASGAAIYCQRNLATFENSTFTDNSANFKGGAIFARKEMYILNCLFKNNKALESWGGAIIGLETINLFNSVFIENTAVYCGAIYAPEVYAINSTFNKNGGATGKMQKYSYGGAIYAEVVNIDSCKFNENYVNREGGAIYLDGDSVSTIKNSIFNGNYAKNAIFLCLGGAIKSTNEIIVESSNFTNNYAQDRGGAIHAPNINLKGYNNFIANEANDYGGAIYSEGNTYINWNDNGNTVFDSNRAKTDGGGAIHGKNIYMKNANFTNNYADDYGGAIYSGGQVSAKSSTFTNNYAAHQGGAMYTNALSLKGYNTFIGNEAKDSGGAIYTNTFSEDVSHEIFICNKAGDDGGAVYINKENSPIISSCYFENNTCKSRGGAIYIDDSSSKVSLYLNIFLNNKAGSKGQTAYACGNFKTVQENWHGINNPNLKDQFKRGVPILPDKDYEVNNYLNVEIAIFDPYVSIENPCEVTVYFVKKDGSKAKDLYNFDAAFNSEFGCITNKRTSNDGFSKVTADVMFNYIGSSASLKATVNQQTLKLENIIVKFPSSVTILSCDNITLPASQTITFKIENRSSTCYTLKNSKGEIVKSGSIGDADSLTFDSLALGHYTITIENCEAPTISGSSASADFIVFDTANVKVSADTVTVGNMTTITVTSDRDGTYHVKLNNKKSIDIDVINGIGSKEIMLDAGTYTTTTTTYNDYYIMNCEESRFSVEKINVTVTLIINNVTFPDYFLGVITTSVSGMYNLRIGDSSEVINLVKDTPYIFTKGIYKVGTYEIYLVGILSTDIYNIPKIYSSVSVLEP